MALKLDKGSALNLRKTDPVLKRIKLELGWEVLSQAIDVDLSVIGLYNGVGVESHVVFFNQNKATDGSIVHSGDNRIGNNDGEAESIDIDLTKLSSAPVDELSIIVTIDRAIIRNQRFKLLKDAYLAIYNLETGVKMGYFDLDASFGECISIQIGSLVKQPDSSWELSILGTGYSDKDFIDIAQAYKL